MQITDVSKDEWQVQKMCIDVDDYELSVEKQKDRWECNQKRESWKWIVSYHGSVVASGSVNSAAEARQHAIGNVPKDEIDEDDCGCD
tara:strand:- start:607 stop:867 length:261 start_codon:yes stop_codon:yes gene_type:complete